MQQVLANCEDRMKKSVGALETDYLALRTGRASAAIFDKVRVDYYGQETPLNQVASVSVPEARLVVIQPWDKSLLGAIEKAIQKSDLGLNPSNDGKLLRINFPPLTQERRKELAKKAKSIGEEAKVAARNLRRKANDDIKKEEKAGELTEDDVKETLEDIQKITDKAIKDIDDIVANKEKEIMEV